MNRLPFFLVTLVGAAIVVWVAARFVGVNGLALAVTALIALAYTAGVLELWRFRQATGTLATALALPPGQVGEPSTWLAGLDPNLREAARGRLEGQPSHLPGPVLTPYLVGLLVMLGLLGTFFGMVDTLSGAVGALQGSTELDAIRAGLAAPIAGLGVAFGTSVAGIAASACLGLLSVLCRRERLLAGRALDTFAHDVFPDQHLERRRQAAFDSLQAQSAAVPAVVERLDALVDRLARLGTELGDTLERNQQQLYGALREDFSRLGEEVGSSLKSSLAESGRMAGEGIRPSMEAAVSALAEHSEATRQQLASLAREQAEVLSEQFTSATNEVHAALTAAGERQGEANGSLAQRIGEGIEQVAREQQARQREQGDQLQEQFQGVFNRMGEMAAAREAAETRWLVQHEERLQALLEQTAGAFDGLANKESERAAATQDRLQALLEQSANAFDGLADRESERAAATQERLQALETVLQEHRAATASADAERLARQEQALGELMTQSAASIAALRDAEGERTVELLDRLQTLQNALQAQGERAESVEAQRLEQQDAQLQAILETTTTQLSALRDAEAGRAEVAAERLQALEGVAAQHLAELGASLEAPLTRLIETASETPKAAAEVIAKLREELSNNVARDNQLLEEREQLLERLQSLMGSLENSAAGQYDVVQSAVSRSAETLAELGEHIGSQVHDGVERLSGLAVDVAGSAGEVASLGEAFRAAVGQFSDANQSLIDGLERMEQAMERSGARSDEQLGYYVAQAREIIDHSVLSQKEIIEELRQLGGQQQLFEPEAAQ
ncbi:DUF802 domain-containing protein [Parahaliea maris]|uniref:DUF802 domain-containing protein n=1 Tax=Parahaliea maris TaxID=2716870 RepID=A0A5C9A0U2_9GAMM|nr:DUF802 domain-containing protein [Parahaliea maris]TXS93031.1 DUF802 domain-containing protein [Parahaliea maris]